MPWLIFDVVWGKDLWCRSYICLNSKSHRVIVYSFKHDIIFSSRSILYDHLTPFLVRLPTDYCTRDVPLSCFLHGDHWFVGFSRSD